MSGSVDRHVGMRPGDLQQQLRDDITAMQYYNSIQIDLAGMWLHPVVTRFDLPSLTVIGSDGAPSGSITSLLYDVARTAMRASRSVVVTSGRDWSARARAECMIGERRSEALARRRPRPDGSESEPEDLVGAVTSGRLTVHSISEDVNAGLAEALGGGTVDLWLFDDVASIAASFDGGMDRAVDVSPVGLRRLSRQRMCAVVVSVDWRTAEAWRWKREADVVLQVRRGLDGDLTIGDGAREVLVPHW